MRRPHLPRPEAPLTEAFLTRRHWLALTGTAALAGCGGGGSPSEPLQAPADTLVHPLGVATGGTGRVRSFLSAPIAAVSPVSVGGVVLNTTTASLSDGDGEPLRSGDLEPGMTARVLAGPIVAGTAQAISLTVDTQVVGPAQWLDSRTAVVLGQRITVDTPTPRGPGAGGTPAAVQVWGRLDLSRGTIAATRVDRARPTDTPMLRGRLAARGADWLQVGALTARAADTALIPAGLQAGSVVRLVLGTPQADGSWLLVNARDDALRPPDGVEAELEGLVTAVAATEQFTLDGVPVDASRAQIQGQGALQVGAQAEVHGQMVNGVLVATAVAVEAPEPLELSGRAADLNPAQRSFSLRGWTVEWTAGTRFSGGTAADLRNGRKLTVKGLPATGSGRLQASWIGLE